MISGNIRVWVSGENLVYESFAQAQPCDEIRSLVLAVLIVLHSGIFQVQSRANSLRLEDCCDC